MGVEKTRYWGAKVETLSGYVYPAKLPIGLGMDRKDGGRYREEIEQFLYEGRIGCEQDVN